VALVVVALVVVALVVVALVVVALATSLMSGPAMKWLLYREEPDEDVVTLLRRGAFVSELHARTPSEAIGELVRPFGSLLTGGKRLARDAVLERELVAATGLGDKVAIPHAAVDGLDRPLLALGRAPAGIDFDAPDGRPARFVFLLILPKALATFTLVTRKEPSPLENATGTVFHAVPPVSASSAFPSPSNRGRPTAKCPAASISWRRNERRSVWHPSCVDAANAARSLGGFARSERGEPRCIGQHPPGRK
jgi:mannitol/fructose-specific phosphotransferase system IIA component (Ntr-type)